MAPAVRPKMAVFGGSFDPVHIGHLFLAGQIVRAGLVEEVLFVPARRPPHKPGVELTAPQHRLSMLKAALAPYAEFSLSDIELERAGVLSYTIDTLETLRQAFPGHELFFLIGMDGFVDLHTWRRASELVQRFSLLIYPRPGVVPPPFAVLAGHFGGRNARKLLDSVVKAQAIPIGATDIRQDLAAGRNLAGRLPESVIEYIREHGLYRSATS